MSSRWTHVRRLPVRRLLSTIAPARAPVTTTSRALRLSAVAALLTLGVHPHPTARADQLPVNRRPEQTAHRVSDLYHALSRCQVPLSESERWRLAGAIHHESHRHGYDPLFIMAMIQVESGCSTTARGERGAVGLVQIKPSTARAVALQAGLPWHGAQTLNRPILNVQLALMYLARLEKRFHDPYLAMVAFNKGPARVGHMSPKRAREARYVKKILARYEDLNDEAAADAAEASL
jgi:soluble lytic murein transglycosylase-like protein